MAASQDGHVEVVNMLLQHGARVDLQNKVYIILRSNTLTVFVIFSVCVYTLHSFLHHPFIEHYHTL